MAWLTLDAARQATGSIYASTARSATRFDRTRGRVGHRALAEHAAPGLVELLRTAGLPRGAQVPDVGCGSGRPAWRLAESGLDVIGVDASPAMIALARAHAPDALVRDITVFRREGDGWRRSDKQHRNVTFEADRAEARASFGQERPLDGLVVLIGRREV